MGAKIIIEKNIDIPMRDGCVLHGDLYRPDGPEKLPVLLNRTPYDKNFPLISALTLDAIRAAQRGYNVVFVDCRGTFASEGTFNCFTDEAQDGYDTIEYLAKQPWADGKVGTFGASYMGATQWLAATQNPPSLKAMAPCITASDYHDGWTYQGGAFSLFFNVSWLMITIGLSRLMREREKSDAVAKELNLRDVVDRHDALADGFPAAQGIPNCSATARPTSSIGSNIRTTTSYWRKLCIEESHAKIDVPAFNIGGWYDIFQGGTIRNYLGMKARGANGLARGSQRLMLGPWNHALPLPSLVGQVDMGFRGSAAAADLDGAQLDFFDYWLKGKQNSVADSAPVKIYVMGLKEWREEKEWPLPGTEWRRYYLHSRGRANSAYGDGALSTETPGAEPPDSYLYNPLNPVQTMGGGLCCYANSVPGGAFDQAAVEHRGDVLVYSTASAQ